MMSKNSSDEIEKLKSENYVARNKVILIERRNSILEEENIIQMKEIKQKKAENENLLSEKKILEKKYSSDISLWTEKYNNLSEKNRILEKESSEKIKELTQLNRTLEFTLGNRIKALNEQIKNREIEFAAELEKTKKEHAQREFTLSLKVEELKKSVTMSDEKILKQEMSIRDLKEKHEKSTAETAGKDNLIKGLVESLERLKTRHDELSRLLKEREDALKEMENMKAPPEKEKAQPKENK